MDRMGRMHLSGRGSIKDKMMCFAGPGLLVPESSQLQFSGAATGLGVTPDRPPGNIIHSFSTMGCLQWTILSWNSLPPRESYSTLGGVDRYGCAPNRSPLRSGCSMTGRRVASVLMGLLLLAFPMVTLADDLVFLTNGGRVRGIVMEADPQKGVSVKLDDGSTRQFAPAEVASVQYSQSEASPLPEKSFPPAPTAVPVAPPQYYPPPSSGPYQQSGSPLVPAIQGPPRARRGFQMALRLGPSIPGGLASNSASMSDYFATQFGGLVEIGGKALDHLFVGVYLGGSGGEAGDMLALNCNSGIACSSSALRIGVEVQYHFLPKSSTNPWLGYGIGYSVGSIKATDSTQSVTINLYGVEWAHLMAGVDFRLNDAIGLGGFLDFTLGGYTSVYDPFVSQTLEIPSENQRTHTWLSIGARIVLFP